MDRKRTDLEDRIKERQANITQANLKETKKQIKHGYLGLILRGITIPLALAGGLFVAGHVNNEDSEKANTALVLTLVSSAYFVADFLNYGFRNSDRLRYLRQEVNRYNQELKEL